jgi:hypothetical protein
MALASRIASKSKLLYGGSQMLLQNEFAVPVRHFAKESGQSGLPPLKGDREFSFTLEFHFILYYFICFI